MRFLLYILSILYTITGTLLALFLVFGGCLNVCPELIIWVYEIGLVLLLLASAVSSWAYARSGARTSWYYKVLTVLPLFLLAVYVLKAKFFFWW